MTEPLPHYKINQDPHTGDITKRLEIIERQLRGALMELGRLQGSEYKIIKLDKHD